MSERFEIIEKNGTPALPAEVMKIMRKARRNDLKMKQLKIENDQIKEALAVAMEEYGIKKFDNDIFTATYTPDHSKVTFDQKGFKEAFPDLYEQFTKESAVKGSLRLSFKE